MTSGAGDNHVLVLPMEEAATDGGNDEERQTDRKIAVASAREGRQPFI